MQFLILIWLVNKIDNIFTSENIRLHIDMYVCQKKAARERAAAEAMRAGLIHLMTGVFTKEHANGALELAQEAIIDLGFLPSPGLFLADGYECAFFPANIDLKRAVTQVVLAVLLVPVPAIIEEVVDFLVALDRN